MRGVVGGKVGRLGCGRGCGFCVGGVGGGVIGAGGVSG